MRDDNWEGAQEEILWSCPQMPMGGYSLEKITIRERPSEVKANSLWSKTPDRWLCLGSADLRSVFNTNICAGKTADVP